MKEKIRKGLSLILALLMIMSVVPFNGIGLSHLGIEAIAVQNTVVESGSCGAQDSNVRWTLYDDGRLVISGEGAMEDYYFEEPPVKSNGTSLESMSQSLDSGVSNSNTAPAFSPLSLFEVETAPKAYALAEKDKSVSKVSIPEFENLPSFDVEAVSKVYAPVEEDETANRVSMLDLASLPSFEVEAAPRAYVLSEEGGGSDTPAEGEGETPEIKYTPWYNHSYEIKEVVVEEGITHIGNSAFQFFVEVLSVQLPESLVSIGDYAFLYCISLETVDLPSSLEEIGVGAFVGCLELTSFVFPESLKRIGSGALYCLLSLEDFTFPGADIEIVGGESLAESISVHGTLTIPEDAVASESINNVVAGSFALDNLYNYSDTVTVSDQLYRFNSRESAEMYWFFSKTAMKISVEAQFYGKEIDENEMCQRVLKEINAKFSKSYSTIEELMAEFEFVGTGPSDFFTLLCKENSAEHTACRENNYAHTIIGSGSECLCYMENVGGNLSETVSWSLNVETKTLIFSGSGEMPDVSMPPYSQYNRFIENIEFKQGCSITRIGDNAFSCLSNVDTLTLPEGVTEIGPGCFANSGIKVLNLPASYIVPVALYFGKLSAIEEINVAEGNEFYVSRNGALYFDYLKYANSSSTEGSSENYNDFENRYCLIKMPEASYDGTYMENTFGTFSMAFENYNTVSCVSLPDSLVFLDGVTFMFCPSLETVIIGKGKTITVEDETVTLEFIAPIAYQCNNFVNFGVNEENTEY